MSDVNISFFTADGLRMDFEETDENVPKDAPNVTFVRVSVKQGTWILYLKPFFNVDAKDAKSENVLIVHEGDEKPIDWSPGSIWSAVSTRDTAIVFQHHQYCGPRKAFDGYGCPDVTSLFPPGEPGGASSLIINPNKKWQLYTQVDYKGLYRDEEPKWYPDPISMKFPNDTLKSLRPR